MAPLPRPQQYNQRTRRPVGEIPGVPATNAASPEIGQPPSPPRPQNNPPSVRVPNRSRQQGGSVRADQPLFMQHDVDTSNLDSLLGQSGGGGRNPYAASAPRPPSYRSDFNMFGAAKKAIAGGGQRQIPDSERFYSDPPPPQQSGAMDDLVFKNPNRGPVQGSGFRPSTLPAPYQPSRSAGSLNRNILPLANYQGSDVQSPIMGRSSVAPQNPGSSAKSIPNVFGQMLGNYNNVTKPRIDSVHSRAEGAREFRSSGGGYTRAGHFSKVDPDGTVHIRSASDGSNITVPYSKLSSEDQNYIKGIVRPVDKRAGRVFTSADGKHTRQGEFAGMDKDGNVQIRMADGRTTRVGYNQLSPSDQSFISSISNGRGRQSPAQSIGSVRGNDSYSKTPMYSNVAGSDEVNNRTGETRLMENAGAQGVADANAFVDRALSQPRDFNAGQRNAPPGPYSGMSGRDMYPISGGRTASGPEKRIFSPEQEEDNRKRREALATRQKNLDSGSVRDEFGRKLMPVTDPEFAEYVRMKKGLGPNDSVMLTADQFSQYRHLQRKDDNPTYAANWADKKERYAERRNAAAEYADNRRAQKGFEKGGVMPSDPAMAERVVQSAVARNRFGNDNSNTIMGNLLGQSSEQRFTQGENALNRTANLDMQKLMGTQNVDLENARSKNDMARDTANNTWKSGENDKDRSHDFKLDDRKIAQADKAAAQAAGQKAYDQAIANGADANEASIARANAIRSSYEASSIPVGPSGAAPSSPAQPPASSGSSVPLQPPSNPQMPSGSPQSPANAPAPAGSSVPVQAPNGQTPLPRPFTSSLPKNAPLETKLAELLDWAEKENVELGSNRWKAAVSKAGAEYTPEQVQKMYDAARWQDSQNQAQNFFNPMFMWNGRKTKTEIENNRRQLERLRRLMGNQ